MAVVKAREAIIASLTRRGEEEKRFEENENMDDEDLEVRPRHAPLTHLAHSPSLTHARGMRTHRHSTLKC